MEHGQGAPIVFQHGNPTSSYLWRRVMPHLAGLGRLIACDLIGMGDSDRLEPSGPDRYGYLEQREHLFELWDRLGLDGDVVLVLHDWGTVLGFDWANQHRDRVAGIAHMEGHVRPMTWQERLPEVRDTFRALRSPAGEAMVLEQNLFIESFLPRGTLRSLTEEEMAAYRKPFLDPGEGRRPMLSFARQLPIEGHPPEVVRIVEDYGAWLAKSDVPKLFVNANPGMVLSPRARQFCRSWSNQAEITVRGLHFVQEDSPDEIGAAISDFVRRIR